MTEMDGWLSKPWYAVAAAKTGMLEKFVRVLGQSSLPFLKTYPHHLNLFHCTTVATSSVPNLRLAGTQDSLSVNLTAHIHLMILISACCNAVLYSLR